MPDPVWLAVTLALWVTHVSDEALAQADSGAGVTAKTVHKTGSHRATRARSGADSPRVLMLSLARCCQGIAWPGAEARLADELRSLGVQVEWVHATKDATGTQDTHLARLGEAHRALAVVRISCVATLRAEPPEPEARVLGPAPSGTGAPPTSGIGAAPSAGRAGFTVVISWHERVTGKTSVQRGWVARRDRHMEALVALRAVELLRASLIETRTPQEDRGKGRQTLLAPPGLLGPAALPAAPLPLRAARWTLRMAGALFHAAGGVDPRGGLLVSLRWWLHPLISLEGAIDITPFGADLEHLGRRTSVRIFGGGLALFWEIQGLSGRLRGPARGSFHWPRRPWRVQPALGLAVGSRILRIKGGETLDYESKRVLRGAVDLAGVAQVAVRITGPLRVRASLQGGAIMPPVGIRYPTGRVATIGWLYLAASLGLELSW